MHDGLRKICTSNPSRLKDRSHHAGTAKGGTVDLRRAEPGTIQIGTVKGRFREFEGKQSGTLQLPTSKVTAFPTYFRGGIGMSVPSLNALLSANQFRPELAAHHLVAPLSGTVHIWGCT